MSPALMILALCVALFLVAVVLVRVLRWLLISAPIWLAALVLLLVLALR
jgi:hypothetical protein